MKLFSCDHCGNTLHFEDTVCERCGHQLGYFPRRNALVSLVEDGGLWSTPVFPDDAYVFCANAHHGACNWLVRAIPGGDVYCLSCRHNEIAPPIEDTLDLARWQAIERAKKRLFYTILRLRLPLHTRQENPVHGLGFRFLAGRKPTIPDDGVVSIALTEADETGHPARPALLSQFRQAIGSHYWQLLVAETPALQAFNDLFGSARHARDDFAQTFARYLQMVDMLEIASATGLSTRTEFAPYAAVDIDGLLDHWEPLADRLDNLDRAMGWAEAHSFPLPALAREKLGFVHELAQSARLPD